MEHFSDIRRSRKVSLGPTLCLFSVVKGAGFGSSMRLPEWRPLQLLPFPKV